MKGKIILLLVVATVGVLFWNGVFKFEVDPSRFTAGSSVKDVSEGKDSGIFQALRAQVFGAARSGGFLFFRTKDQVVDAELSNVREDMQYLVQLVDSTGSQSSLEPAGELLLKSIDELTIALSEASSEKNAEVKNEITDVFTTVNLTLNKAASKGVVVPNLKTKLLAAQRKIEAYTNAPIVTPAPVADPVDYLRRQPKIEAPPAAAPVQPDEQPVEVTD